MSSKKTIEIDGKVYNFAADLYGMRLFAKKKGIQHIEGIQEFFSTIETTSLTFDQMDDMCLLVQSFIESSENEIEAPTMKELYSAIFNGTLDLAIVFEAISEGMPAEEDLGNGKKQPAKRQVKRKTKAKK